MVRLSVQLAIISTTPAQYTLLLPALHVLLLVALAAVFQSVLDAKLGLNSQEMIACVLPTLPHTSMQPEIIVLLVV